jgi:FkbM family methyltransferase
MSKKNNMMKKILKKASQIVMSLAQSKLRFQKIFEYLYILALKGMNYGGGSNPSDSGEIYVLNYIENKLRKSESPIIIFDVGANVGGYSLLIIEILKNIKTKIFSFEPSQLTFEKLKESVSQFKNVSLFNFGFGKDSGKFILFSDQKHSGLASLYNRKLGYRNINLSNSEEVEIKTIDNFCSENNISHIHFLKLDVEGNELDVLTGAQTMIKSGKIDYIQFEFGGSNIDSRTYFQDFFFLLNPKYKIFRIVKDGIYPIDTYKETSEIFTTTNYLAEMR